MLYMLIALLKRKINTSMQVHLKKVDFMAEKKKTKPIRLEWNGNIAVNSDEGRVSLKSTITPQPSLKKAAQNIQGKVKIRTESKGRAGKPVAIIFNFTDPEAQNEESLKLLCTKLKTALACGGTIENNEIILTIRDIQKLKEVLKKNSLTCD